METQLTIPARSKAVRIDEHPAAIYLASLGKGSRRTMRAALDSIALLITGNANALTVNWSQLRFQHTQAIRSALAERYAAATANKMLSALRGVLRQSYLLGEIHHDDYERATKYIEGVKGETLPAGRALTNEEIAAILDVCVNDPRPKGARDGALIALLRGGGMRRQEICDLELAHYDRADVSFKVRGKRNKERRVPIQIQVADALTDWLVVRGVRDGPLFCSITKGGHLTHKKLSPTAIYNTVNERAAQAGVSHLSPHDFRRTFAGDLLDEGADIVTVQKLMGHANVQTTAKYDRRGEATKRKAADLLHVPYRRRMTLIPPYQKENPENGSTPTTHQKTNAQTIETKKRAGNRVR